MSRLRSALPVVLGVAALAIPAGAIAAHGEGNAKGHAKQGKAKGHGKDKAKGKGHAKSHNVGYVFKGFYAGDGTVDVERGNRHVHRADLIGEMVEFDLSDARIVARDVNGDGERTLDDVATGDWVLLKSRLPRSDPGSQPFEAKHLIDKTSFRTGDDTDESS